MFTYYEKANAPPKSQALLESTEKSIGMIPNLYKILAEAPITYEIYTRAFHAFLRESTFSQLEAQVVFMTANYENRCHYCIPGHTWAMKSAKMPEEIIEALREGQTLPDPKLEALRQFTKLLLDKRGDIGEENLKAFLNAGYNTKHALEVLCGLSAKLISNFTNGLSKTKLDAPMQPYVWTHPKERT